MNATLGEIDLFALNFAPAYWLECAGQTLNISTNDPFAHCCEHFITSNGMKNQ